jgi:hypothetical protein
MMRTAALDRHTKETRISGSLKIEGHGNYQIATGIRFFDHMLELFTRHGGFDLKLAAEGDLDVDQHHTVEDVGIVLGQLFAKALGDRKGINRAGYFVMPMDETLAVVAVGVFGLASIGAFLIFDWPPFLRDVVFEYLMAFLELRLVMVVSRFLLAPPTSGPENLDRSCRSPTRLRASGTGG